MGLYNIIKQKKGEKELNENEEAADFCKSLPSEFKGVMRLYGSRNGKTCTAALFIENGNVTGASFEDAASRKTVHASEAVENIKKKLLGTKGDLEIYSFKDDSDMEKAKKSNQESLLTCTVPFSTIGMKIKSRENVDGWNINGGNQPDYFAAAGRIRLMKIEEKFDLADFARKFSLNLSAGESDLQDLEKEVGKADKDQCTPEGRNILGSLVDAKRERLAELKKKRQMEDLELMKKMSQITTKKQETEVANVKKVETSIDKLYQMVQQQRRLRIDNDLARKLGVNRAQIENWAMILEEHNLVELHYPAIGEPEIRKLGERG